MDDEDPQIIELAQAVSDDRPIDWAAAERSARDPAMQAVIRELSLIAKLARLSRQSVDATSSDGLLDDARDASTTMEGGIGTWAHLRLLEARGEGRRRGHPSPTARVVGTPRPAGAAGVVEAGLAQPGPGCRPVSA